MVASHVVAEFAFEMLDQLCNLRGCLATIDG